MSGLATGLLDRRLRIEVSMVGHDGYNETRTWSELATVWARYLPTRGREAREQMGQESLSAASFQIRWSSKVAPLVSPAGTATYRLRYPADGQAWDIKSAIEMGRREGIEIVAAARADAPA